MTATGPMCSELFAEAVYAASSRGPGRTSRGARVGARADDVLEVLGPGNTHQVVGKHEPWGQDGPAHGTRVKA